MGPGCWTAIRLGRPPSPVSSRGKPPPRRRRPFRHRRVCRRQPSRGCGQSVRGRAGDGALALDWPCATAGDGGREAGNTQSGLTAAEACACAHGTMCVGQAANPGPAAPIRWVSSLAASALAYALPGRVGFHGVHTPGFASVDAGPPRQPFTLRLLTANTTGWSPLQRLLRETESNVIFAQEHRLLPESIPAASAWARKHGWKTVWAPAKRGAGGGAAGGTVICARSFMGLRHPDKGDAIVVEGHMVAAVVEPPGCRPFVGYAGYFHNGQGLSRANLALAAAVGAHWEAMEDSTLQLVLGADFNMEPSVFARADLPKRVWGRLVVPLTPRGTCRTRTKAATYDYYFMTAAMADLVSSVVSVEGTGVKTHAPTAATFHPRLATLKSLSIRSPPQAST